MPNTPRGTLRDAGKHRRASHRKRRETLVNKQRHFPPGRVGRTRILSFARRGLTAGKQPAALFTAQMKRGTEPPSLSFLGRSLGLLQGLDEGESVVPALRAAEFEFFGLRLARVFALDLRKDRSAIGAANCPVCSHLLAIFAFERRRLGGDDPALIDLFAVGVVHIRTAV